jgi:hypothetical protein
MVKFLSALLLIGVAIFIFYQFTNPLITEISSLWAQKDKLNDALDNARKLREEQAKLLVTYGNFNPADLERLGKLLPDNIDNIKLIIDVNNIAKPYNMTVKNIKIKLEEEPKTVVVRRPVGAAAPAPVAAPASTMPTNQRGTVFLDFSVTGSYTSFKSFLADLVRSLRLADVVSTSFAANDQGTYDYNVQIKTYWLK